ncbi:MAG: SDR family NAD(P)-dependent oxidoreductase [candidate division WOR-3 bacterium]|nr:MAG: SDR family NAD(P)-dependent oxidoreductase [candidate division WOR-3 bacterium]
MNWKNKRVFITGAGGFIGSHLCEKLVQIGAEVTALVRYNSKGSHGFLEDTGEDIKKNIKIVFGDIRDESTFRLHLKEQNMVFHLAAVPGIPYSFMHPHDVFDTNTLGSLNLLNAAREFDLEKIILVSSAETYGDAKYTPIDEKHPQFPKSPYAASKAAMEKFGWSFYFAYALPLTIVRLFNNYGPRQSARAVTPTIITQVLYGDHVRIGALDPRRDFIFVLDTVGALLKVAELKDNGDVFNIGSGIDISVGEILDTVKKIIGKQGIKVITDKARIRPEKSEVPLLRADCTHIHENTGWKPEFSYEEGLRLTVEWIREHMNIYKPGTYNI